MNWVYNRGEELPTFISTAREQNILFFQVQVFSIASSEIIIIPCSIFFSLDILSLSSFTFSFFPNWFFSSYLLFSRVPVNLFRRLFVSMIIVDIDSASGGGGQNFERRNVERLKFRNFKVANMKITNDESLDSFINEYIFSFFRYYLNTQNI